MRQQAIKFVLIGILNTIVGYGAYFFFLKVLSFNYIIALVLSHIIGVLHSFLWNNKWTFGAKKVELWTVLKFVTMYGVTFLVNLTLLFVFVHWLKIDQLLSQMIALLATTLISFFGHKYWTFSRGSRVNV